MADEPLSTEDAARLAYLVSAVGVAGALTLILMYAIEVPRGGPYVIGGINDVTGGVYNLAVIPLLLRLGREGDQGPGWRMLTRATVGSSVLSSASSFLLVAKVLPFAPSAAVNTLAIVVQAGWMLGFGRRNRTSSAYSGGTLRLGRLIGIGTFVGLPLLGLGFLFARKSVPRVAAFAAGGTAGGGAWAAIPAFWFAVARSLRQRPA
jgi:hypothetical protein